MAVFVSSRENFNSFLFEVVFTCYKVIVYMGFGHFPLKLSSWSFPADYHY